MLALQLYLPLMPHLPGRLGHAQAPEGVRSFPPVCWLGLNLSLSPGNVLCLLHLCEVIFPGGSPPLWLLSPHCSAVCFWSFSEQPVLFTPSPVRTLWPVPWRPRRLHGSPGPSCNVPASGSPILPGQWAPSVDGQGALEGRLEPALTPYPPPGSGCLSRWALWIAVGSAPWRPAGDCSMWVAGLRGGVALVPPRLCRAKNWLVQVDLVVFLLL